MTGRYITHAPVKARATAAESKTPHDKYYNRLPKPRAPAVTQEQSPAGGAADLARSRQTGIYSSASREAKRRAGWEFRPLRSILETLVDACLHQSPNLSSCGEGV